MSISYQYSIIGNVSSQVINPYNLDLEMVMFAVGMCVCGKSREGSISQSI